MLIYEIWEFFGRERRGRMEIERGQACVLMLLMLFICVAGMIAD